MKLITKRGAGISSIVALFLLPNFAFASVQITEIMYDAPGADTGREWIEVTNTASVSVDIGKYKLEESGTNHALKLISGSAALAPGASAIIVADAAKFAADNPGFSGTVFDSAFNLSNTGELLVFKNASSTPLDSVSYTATEGANGEGGSLHLSSGAFVVAMPNPGVYPGALTEVPKVVAPVKATKTTTSKSTAPKSKVAGNSAPKTAAVTPAQNIASPSLADASNFAIPPLVLWLLGLGALTLLGVAGICFVLLGKKETSLSAEDFKIQ